MSWCRCKRCDKYKLLYYDRKVQQDKIILLVEDLMKTQKKLLEYLEELKPKTD